MIRSASKRHLLVLLFALAPTCSLAQTLNDRQIYERCSARLTRVSPDDSKDPFIPLIEKGTLTGVAACQQLLGLAKLGSNGVIASYSKDAQKRFLAERVLATMNDVHASWLTEKTFVASNGCREDSTNSLVDPLEPALFFTRALLGPSVPFSYVVTGKDNLRALRSENNPQTNIWDKRLPALSNMSGSWRLAGHGKLLGVSSGYSPKGIKMEAYFATEDENKKKPVLNDAPLLKNLGAGIIGSQAYILNNFGEGIDWVPDLEKMPRNWSKWVFKDLLCRELPVLFKDDKIDDTKAYTVCDDKTKCGIKPTAAKKSAVLSFRDTNACVQCHATMDQMIGVVRNLRSFHGGRCNINGSTPPIEAVASQWLPVPPTLAKDTTWDYVADPDYRKRAPAGRMYFRDIYGKLVNEPISSVADIGTILSKRDDIYICAAKRYYQYFTGIDVELVPMTDAEAAKLPPDKKFYRDRVFTLGKNLRASNKYNQDAQKLIEAIFALPEYKAKDFKLIQTAQGK